MIRFPIGSRVRVRVDSEERVVGTVVKVKIHQKRKSSYPYAIYSVKIDGSNDLIEYLEYDLK